MASFSPRPLEHTYPVSRPVTSPALPKKSYAPQPAGIPSSEKVKWLLTVLTCSLIAIYIVAGYSRIAQNNLDLEKQKLAIQKLSIENDKLKDQRAKLSAPERLLQIAADKLHMMPASEAGKGKTANGS